MRIRTLKSWLLLSYLVLLLNLGPSLHFVDFFGLHPHASIGSNSCDCLAHQAHDSRQDAVRTQSADTESSMVPDHDCAFCKFFDEYNVVVYSFQFDRGEAPVFLLAFEVPDATVSDTVAKVARGPPTA